MNQLNAQYPQAVRARDYVPNVFDPVLVHAGHGVPGGGLSCCLPCGEPGSAPQAGTGPWFLLAAPWAVVPFLMNTAGWS